MQEPAYTAYPAPAFPPKKWALGVREWPVRAASPAGCGSRAWLWPA